MNKDNVGIKYVEDDELEIQYWEQGYYLDTSWEDFLEDKREQATRLQA